LDFFPWGLQSFFCLHRAERVGIEYMGVVRLHGN
jgi:hypothetical protein